MIMIVEMEVMKARIVKIISEPANQSLSLPVKMLNVLPRPTNVTERTIVETLVMNITVITKTAHAVKTNSNVCQIKNVYHTISSVTKPRTVVIIQMNHFIVVRTNAPE